MTEHDIERRLQEFMEKAFDPADLDQFVRFQLGTWLSHIAAPGTMPARIFELIQWYRRRHPDFLQLLRLVDQVRPNNQELLDILQDAQSVFPRVPSSATKPIAIPSPITPTIVHNQPVANAVAEFDKVRGSRQSLLEAHAQLIRSALMEKPLASDDLVAAQNSFRQGDRLAAILQLSLRPDAGRFFWLSERVATEAPTLAAAAAKALFAACQNEERLRDNTYAVLLSSAVSEALERVEANDPCETIKGELRAAVFELKMRLK